jgi:hypothetical protein
VETTETIHDALAAFSAPSPNAHVGVAPSKQKIEYLERLRLKRAKPPSALRAKKLHFLPAALVVLNQALCLRRCRQTHSI